jgi:MFS family permease
MFGGAGHGMCSVSYRSLVLSESKSRRERNIGRLEACIGVGYLIGPLFGSITNELGGTRMPFIMSSMVLILSFPFVVYSLTNSKTKRLLK